MIGTLKTAEKLNAEPEGRGRERDGGTSGRNKGMRLAARIEANRQVSVQMRSRRRKETGAIGWTQAKLLRSLKYEIGDPRPRKKKPVIREGIQIKKSFHFREKQAPLKRDRTKFHVCPG